MTKEQVELALVDMLEQLGATVGTTDSATSIEALRLTDVEFDDLAEDLRAEFGIMVDSAEIRRAKAVGDVVDLVVRGVANS